MSGVALSERLPLIFRRYCDVTVVTRHCLTVIVLLVTETASFSSPFKVPLTASMFEMQLFASSPLQNCASNLHV
jgi:hypothetical protein